VAIMSWDMAFLPGRWPLARSAAARAPGRRCGHARHKSITSLDEKRMITLSLCAPSRKTSAIRPVEEHLAVALLRCSSDGDMGIGDGGLEESGRCAAEPAWQVEHVTGGACFILHGRSRGCPTSIDLIRTCMWISYPLCPSLQGGNSQGPSSLYRDKTRLAKHRQCFISDFYSWATSIVKGKEPPEFSRLATPFLATPNLLSQGPSHIKTPAAPCALSRLITAT
jgi:hypothetical protein